MSKTCVMRHRVECTMMTGPYYIRIDNPGMEPYKMTLTQEPRQRNSSTLFGCWLSFSFHRWDQKLGSGSPTRVPFAGIEMRVPLHTNKTRAWNGLEAMISFGTKSLLRRTNGIITLSNYCNATQEKISQRHDFQIPIKELVSAHVKR